MRNWPAFRPLWDAREARMPKFKVVGHVQTGFWETVEADDEDTAVAKVERRVQKEYDGMNIEIEEVSEVEDEAPALVPPEAGR